jgi:hypothetical protein
MKDLLTVQDFETLVFEVEKICSFNIIASFYVFEKIKQKKKPSSFPMKMASFPLKYKQN